MTEKSQSRNVTWEAEHGGTLLTGFLPTGLLTSLSYTPKTTYLRMALPSHTSQARKCSIDLPMGIFSIKIPSTQIHLGCVKLTKSQPLYQSECDSQLLTFHVISQAVSMLFIGFHAITH